MLSDKALSRSTLFYYGLSDLPVMLVIIPMAISLGFGILFATAIILVLVPCLYLILEDFRRLAGAVPKDAS